MVRIELWLNVVLEYRCSLSGRNVVQNRPFPDTVSDNFLFFINILGCAENSDCRDDEYCRESK